jgi:hypothetical protein
MIRFILQYRLQNHEYQNELIEHYTLDIEVPELEQNLLSGGYEDGHEINVLTGAEVIKSKDGNK